MESVWEIRLVRVSLGGQAFIATKRSTLSQNVHILIFANNTVIVFPKKMTTNAHAMPVSRDWIVEKLI
jgi:hypothetical protein